MDHLYELHQFMLRLQRLMPEKAWRKLKFYAKKGVIKWGEFTVDAGPSDDSGG